MSDDDVRGTAVHVAARVAALAQPNECLVTRTVKDLVAGADIRLIERGKRDLKGLTEPIDLFTATASLDWSFWPLIAGRRQALSKRPQNGQEL